MSGTPRTDPTEVFALGVGGSGTMLERAWGELERATRGLAWRLTDDRQFREDLIQEARIELWLIDPTRFDLNVTADVQYLRRMVTNRMMDAWAAERKAIPQDGVLT